MPTTISQYGITWYISGDHSTGSYANGDYWVQGPVTITGISPASTFTTTKSGEIFISSGSNATITWSGHGLPNFQTFRLLTEGILPSPLETGYLYFVDDYNKTANTFRITSGYNSPYITVKTTGVGPFTGQAVRIKNGTMINPVAAQNAPQGFDSSMSANTFVVGLNYARPNEVDLSEQNPLIVSGTSSLISSISHATAGNRPQLTDAAVLTVVDTIPKSGAFRPPYCSGNKINDWNVTGLDFNLLNNFIYTGAPDLTTVSNYFARPWIEINTQYGGREMHPSNNQQNYGQYMAKDSNLTMLSLHLNYTNDQKRLPYLRVVQYGIDVYGAAVAGGVWANNGGHNMGRKMPLILAGMALNDTGILYWGNAANKFIFQDDQQTFYVSQTEVDITNGPTWSPDTRGGTLPYSSGDIGIPEWGITHYSDNRKDNAIWTATYRDVNYSASFGQAVMSFFTTGSSGVWNWQPYFDYYLNRVWNIEQNNAGGANKIQNFAANLYRTYGISGGGSSGSGNSGQAIAPSFSPIGGFYSSGFSVTLNAPTSGSVIYYTTDGSTPNGSSSIYSSPISIGSSTVMQAYASASGYSNSEVSSASYLINGGFISDDQWQSVHIGHWNDTNLRIKFDANVSRSPLDSIIGFGELLADTSSDLAGKIRFSTFENIEAFNASGYSSDNQFVYTSGINYSFVIDINVPSQRYSVSCVQSGQSYPTEVASRYIFDSGLGNVGYINYFSFYTASPYYTYINNLEIQTPTQILRIGRFPKFKSYTKITI